MTHEPEDHSLQAAGVFNKYADAYNGRFMDLDLYNDTYDKLCGLMKKTGASVLELGCGPGNITRYLLQQRPDLKIHATDLAPNMVKLAAQNNPAAIVDVMDCRDISRLTQTFDGIVCGFCIPYLSLAETGKLVQDCGAKLNTNGLLYLSTIEGHHSQSGYEYGSDGKDKCFVHYYEAAYLEELLHKAHLEVKELLRKSYTKSDGTVQTHLIFIAQKNMAGSL